MEVGSRLRSGIILALPLLLLWQLWAGAARSNSTVGPAGEAGLCLALVCWWCGGRAGVALSIWTVALLSAAALTGVAPLWGFLVGWPAWLMVRALAAEQRFPAFWAMAVVLVSLVRCGGKLLLLAAPAELGTRLTLSGTTLASSLWAEAAPNLIFLALFAWLLGAGQTRVRPA